MEDNMTAGENGERKKRQFTIVDYWFHFGVLINLIVVVLLLWYAAT